MDELKWLIIVLIVPVVLLTIVLIIVVVDIVIDLNFVDYMYKDYNGYIGEADYCYTRNWGGSYGCTTHDGHSVLVQEYWRIKQD